MAEIIKLRRVSDYRVYARDNVGTIYLYGIIGDSLFSDGITAKQLADDLRKLGRLSTLNVRINSEGGDVFQGKTIYSLLKANPARIVAHVDGLAASAASLVAMAAHEIKIADGSFMMVHSAWSRVTGNAADMREAAALLEQVDQSIIDTYAGRTGQTREQVAAWMAAETWFNAADAKAYGFADQIVENMKVAAMISDPSQFKNLPAGMKPRRDRVQSYLASLTKDKG